MGASRDLKWENKTYKLKEVYSNLKEFVIWYGLEVVETKRLSFVAWNLKILQWRRKKLDLKIHFWNKIKRYISYMLPLVMRFVSLAMGIYANSIGVNKV